VGGGVGVEVSCPQQLLPLHCIQKVFHVQPEDGHCQAPKHVVVPYVVNTIYTSDLYHQIKTCVDLSTVCLTLFQYHICTVHESNLVRSPDQLDMGYMYCMRVAWGGGGSGGPKIPIITIDFVCVWINALHLPKSSKSPTKTQF